MASARAAEARRSRSSARRRRGKTEAALALAGALGAEIVSVDSMLVYRGMDVGTAKPDPAERAAVAASPDRRGGARRSGSPWRASKRSRCEAVDGRSRSRAAAAAGRRVGPVLPGGRGRLEFPGTDPGTRAELEAEAGRSARPRCTRGSARWIRRPPRRSSRPTCGAPCERWRSRRSPAARSRAFADGVGAHYPERVAAGGHRARRRDARRRIERARAPHARRGFARGGARPASSGASAAGSRRARPSATLRSRDTSRGLSARGGRRRHRRSARRRWPAVRWPGSGETRAIRWFDGGPGAARPARSTTSRVSRSMTDASTSRSTRGPGNDFVMVVGPRRRAADRARRSRPRSATGARGVGADGLDPHRARRGATRGVLHGPPKRGRQHRGDVRQRDPLPRQARRRPRASPAAEIDVMTRAGRAPSRRCERRRTGASRRDGGPGVPAARPSRCAARPGRRSSAAVRRRRG